MKSILKEVATSTFRTLRTAPLALFGLQFAEGLSSVLAKMLEGPFDRNPILAALLFFPFFCAASAISNGLTFLYLRDFNKGKTLTFRELWQTLQPTLPKLLLASLALGLVIILGFAALVLPAFYFMAIYLFVPLEILNHPEFSLSRTLVNSKRRAKTALLPCFMTVVLSLAIGILTFLVSESLGRWAGGITSVGALQQVTSLGIDAFFSMLTGAIIDTWVIHLFFRVGKHD